MKIFTFIILLTSYTLQARVINIIGDNNFDVTASTGPPDVAVSVGALAFTGIYDGTKAIQSTTILNITAEPNQTYEIELSNGDNHDGSTRKLKGNGGGAEDYIKYELRMNSHTGPIWEGGSKFTGIGDNTQQQITIYGSTITEDNWSGGDSTTFSDNINITIHYP